MLGAAAAALGLSVVASRSSKASAPTVDAALLTASERFAEVTRLIEADPPCDPSTLDTYFESLAAEQARLFELIVKTPATCLAGHQARARAFRAWDFEGDLVGSTYWNDRLLLAFVRDLAGPSGEDTGR